MYSESNNDFYTKTGYKLHYKIVQDIGKLPLVLIHGQGMCGQAYETLFKKVDENDEQITVKLKWWCLL